MKTRPILFSGPMVRAILDGRKTQIRRVINPQPSKELNFIGRIAESTIKSDIGKYSFADRYPCARQVQRIACPYGKPGDRLWVKETFQTGDFAQNEPRGFVYRATDPDWESSEGWKWKPSIFMPRAASRITLEITSVRVERLRNIENAPLDIAAEGMPKDSRMGDIQWYRDLWQSINGISSWNENPFVWVITFKRIKP